MLKIDVKISLFKNRVLVFREQSFLLLKYEIISKLPKNQHQIFLKFLYKPNSNKTICEVHNLSMTLWALLRSEIIAVYNDISDFIS